jgi:hypothetical protein
VKSNYKGGGGGARQAQGSGAKPSVAYMLLKNVNDLPKSLKVDDPEPCTISHKSLSLIPEP